jgi:DNA-binding response OmpR family regulator
MARILVIDDDPDIRTMLDVMLKASGHQVTLAADGKEGLNLFREQPTDVVITDIFMPNQEGIETVILFRRNFPGVPIIAMSGEPGGGTALTVARRMGAAAVLEKPFFPNQVLIAIDNALRFEPKRPEAFKAG